MSHFIDPMRAAGAKRNDEHKIRRDRDRIGFKAANPLSQNLADRGWTELTESTEPLSKLNRTAAHMKLLSVCVGVPREVAWKGKTVTTAIFKQPVAGRIALRKLNLEGDRQADLSVHGGSDKAAYVYPAEHYTYWKAELPDRDLPWGSFGENFTTEGLLEESVHIGDRFRIGSAEVIVTQPRLPCYKLSVKFGLADMVKRFSDSRLTGFYVAV